MWWLAVSVLALLILYSLLQGAPYVPTKRKDALEALKLLNLPRGSLIIDVGCGDGKVLKLAAEQGYRAVGIEINPLLWAIASWQCRHKNVKIVLGNLWYWHLPARASGVFVFTAGPFVTRFEHWLSSEQKRLQKPLRVVSLGFALPGRRPVKQADVLFLYKFD